MLISALRISEASFFKEKNVTDFVKAFNNLYNDYKINKKNRIIKVSRYYKRNICKYIQSLLKFKDSK